MFSPANQAHFALHIDGVEHDFKVLEFTGVERLNQPYTIELTLVSEQPDIDLGSLLHRPAWLDAGLENGLHGFINQLTQGESGRRLTRYLLRLGPQLSYLEHRTNQRIFQHKTAEQIIACVMQEHAMHSDTWRFNLNAELPVRRYCTQYDESDLHFIQRLCEEEGLHFHFEHSRQGHELVFGDDQTSFPQLSPIGFSQGSGMVADQPVVKRFSLTAATRPDRVSRRDYNFEKPHLSLEAEAQLQRQSAQPALEDYDYPGRFGDRERGKQLSQIQLQRHRSHQLEARGECDRPDLRSGHFLSLTGHPRDDWNDLWLLTEVHHHGKQPQALEESITSNASAADGFVQGYRNRFIATPWQAIWRPPLEHPKPRIAGSQSAVVTGPAGEEIHCDQHGRVKVQFHWDREAQADEHTSCWLRVATGWAGDRYGTVAIPRIGMEVLVSFLEGDPDQPLITGCLYHAEHVPPVELPAHKTRSAFKSLSSPGGEGYNELRIEDRKGAEQIYIHAQRDWDQRIEHDQRVHVGNERHEHTVANHYSECQAELHRTVHGDRLTELKASDHLSIKGSQHSRIEQRLLIDVGQEAHLASGRKIVLEAGIELTIKAGGSFIKLDPSGVTISGPTVRVNSGGSPGNGTGASPRLPGDVTAADSGQAGNLLVPAQRQALMLKKPLCAICKDPGSDV
ncbi:type VI secretion system tip protein TssI/VgrG [Halopseudomonas sp.]|uniref:type VI secretion system Vgr family protein n=1 Tax=Halopseudomonas sp. TaxID=2901191 RepID=UPI00311F6161